MSDLRPVPDCEGPRLHPYSLKGTPEIEFIDEIGKGAHGYVFKVKIDGKILALKVFMNQLLSGDWITPEAEQWENVDEKLLTAQWHPFNAECRAYARLKEAGKEQLAVRCHGYTVLTPSQERELVDRFEIQTWWSDDYEIDPSDSDYDQGPRRALIKEYIESDRTFGPKDAPRMIKDLNHLHRCGIVVHDLKEDAYLGGKLVDLSKAITVPHMIFDTPLGKDLDYFARYEVQSDLSFLAGMFEDWNEDHEHGPRITCRPFPDVRACEKLRSGKKTTSDLIYSCINPREIDWRKFKQDSREVASANARAATGKSSGRASSRVKKIRAKRKVSRARKGKH
ncbi:hypothetical protein diail_2679 [Diaporthe ilicicola]|nr:hypothetical protein diail_2679 [Diaporthe ilicicola]